MIIACSAKALQSIERAVFERVGKKDAVPVVVSDKEQLTLLRTFLDEDHDSYGLLWNLDIEESPVRGDNDKQVGIFRTGYLFNRDLGLSVVLNGLDCADMHRIGDTVKSGIMSVYNDLVVVPEATSRYFEDIENKARHILETIVLERNPRVLFKSPAIIFQSGDRSTTGILAGQKDMALAYACPDGVRYISTEPVDRTLCFRLNNDFVKVREMGAAKRDYELPIERTRQLLHQKYGDKAIPAIKIRIQLMECGDKSFDPPCTRDIVVPFDAPLAWVHHMIQKAFNWADYHLHDFNFLDDKVRKIFDDAINDIFELDAFCSDGDENIFKSKDGERLFVEHTRLSLRWLYGDCVRGLEDGGQLDNEYPQAQLPENMALGLALFGSQSYQEILNRLNENVCKIDISDYAYNAIRYLYDYGDYWELSITPLNLLLETAGDLPRIADACGHTPPEDCGGTGGFVEFLKDIDLKDDFKREGVNLRSWAKKNGWRSFVSVEDLAKQFDSRSTWGWD